MRQGWGTARADKEAHWPFRAIAADNPIAAQNRIRDAVAEAGQAKILTARRLTLLRNTSYPTGAKTDEIRNDFEALADGPCRSAAPICGPWPLCARC